jgi:two-component system, cell cycle sensor histidine kinase and response regulator CckA
MSSEGRRAPSVLVTLRDMLEAAPDAMLVVDRAGQILLGNSQAETLFGYAPGELSERSVEDLVPERFHATHPGQRDAYAKAPHHRPLGTRLDLFARRKDGREFPAEISLKSVAVDGGEHVTIAAVRDVSASKLLNERLREQNQELSELAGRERATDALRLAQERLEHVLSSSPAVLFTLRLGGGTAGLNLEWISSNVERILGYTVDEAMVSNHFSTHLHPDDSERVLAELAQLPLKGLVEQEYRFRDKAGVYRWLRAELRLLRDAAGTPTEVVGSWSDVGTRKAAELQLIESERQYRLLFQNNPHPTFVVDSETLAFLAVNDAAVRHYGYSRDEFLALTAADIRPPDELPALKRAIEGAEKEHVPSQSLGLLKHRKKDRTIIEVDIAASGITFLGRRAWLVLATDVTEKRGLENQLGQAQKMEAVGQLAGGVAHDFNNLLGVITGYSELLLRGPQLGERDRRRLEQIAKAADSAASLTRQLLAFSRKQMLQPTVLDLNEILGNVEKMLRRLIGEDIEFITECEPAIGRVRADAGQIEQVIMNLAVNARDAMPKGGRLTLRTGNAELEDAATRNRPDVAPGRYVVLSVADTGHGMEAATQAHIFEPFFTTKEPGRGTGLGLATVYGIVKQSGGHLEVHSEPGRGTTFAIYLPRIDAEVEAPTAKPASRPPRGTETILLLEDDDALRALVGEVLEDAGYTVLQGATPAEALALAQQHAGAIHALLTDVVLPGVSGPELASQLAASRPEMRVLFMSGYTDAAIGDRGLLSAQTAFIHKPFTTDALLHKLRAVLDTAPGSPA